MLALDALFSTGNQKWSRRGEKYRPGNFNVADNYSKKGSHKVKYQAILVALVPVTWVYHLPTDLADKMPISLVRTELSLH